MRRVLFVCVHNSCRSILAEGLVRGLFADKLEAASAGTRPAQPNPMALEALAERGVPFREARSKSLEEVRPETFDAVITLCEEGDLECPPLPPSVKRISWPLPDPARATGTEKQRREAFRKVRDELENRIRRWLRENPPAP